MKNTVRKGELRQIGDIHFIFVKNWMGANGPDSVWFVVPVRDTGAPKTTTEFGCITKSGRHLVAQCWNVRTISTDTLSRSCHSPLGEISRSERQRMWHVVRHAITGVDMPQEVQSRVGSQVTERNCSEITGYQTEWAKRFHLLQEDLFKEMYEEGECETEETLAELCAP